MKNNMLLTQNENNTTIDSSIAEKPQTSVTSNNHVKDVKQYSFVNNSKSYDKQDGQNQVIEKIPNGLYSRYHLNVRNYVMELHKALMKECKDYLLDSSSMNSRLNFESISSITNQTWNAIKVLTVSYTIKMHIFKI